MDKRLFIAGITILAVGIIISLYLYNNTPVGKPDMTQDQTIQFYQDEATFTSLSTLFQIVAGIGFFLLLISIGLKKRPRLPFPGR